MQHAPTGHRHRRSRRIGQEHHRRSPRQKAGLRQPRERSHVSRPRPQGAGAAGLARRSARRFAHLAAATVIQLEPQPDGNRVLLDGRDVSQRIREGDVTLAASRVSIHPPVRADHGLAPARDGRQRRSRHGRPRHRHRRLSQRRRKSLPRRRCPRSRRAPRRAKWDAHSRRGPAHHRRPRRPRPARPHPRRLAACARRRRHDHRLDQSLHRRRRLPRRAARHRVIELETRDIFETSPTTKSPLRSRSGRFVLEEAIPIPC